MSTIQLIKLMKNSYNNNLKYSDSIYLHVRTLFHSALFQCCAMLYLLISNENIGIHFIVKILIYIKVIDRYRYYARVEDSTNKIQREINEPAD